MITIGLNVYIRKKKIFTHYVLQKYIFECLENYFYFTKLSKYKDTMYINYYYLNGGIRFYTSSYVNLVCIDIN